MTSEEEFVVYMHSSENLDQYPQNTPGAFSNSFQPSIHLSDEYEVGLQNIIYSPKFDAILKDDTDFSIRIFTQFLNPDGSSYNGTGFTYLPTQNILGENIHLAIRALNDDFLKILKVNRLVDKTQEYVFKHNFRTNLVTFKDLIPPANSKYKKYKTKWIFSKDICRLLGCSENETFNPNFTLVPKLPEIEYLYIHSDIVSPSRIGSQQVHILDILPTKNTEVKNSTSLIYKPVTCNNINTISIKITTDRGKIVPFQTSVTVIIVLHFRLRRYK